MNTGVKTEMVLGFPRDKIRNVAFIMRDDKRRPDGPPGSADSLLLRPLKEAIFQKLKVPGDIQFAGIGNTPWSSVDSVHPFSSIDFATEYRH